MPRVFTLRTLAERLDAELIGDGAVLVSRLAHPDDYRDAGDLVLAMDDRLMPKLAGQNVVAAVVAGAAMPDPPPAPNVLRVARPRLALAHLTNFFAPQLEFGVGIHPSAVVDSSAEIAPDAVIGPFCCVGARVSIAAGVVLQGQVTVEAGASIGANSILRAGVRIGANCIIGARAIIHFNTSIGADGFSFVTPEIGSVETARSGGAITATNAGGLVRIASLGAVVIGDDVEIGANTSIDRGTILPTRIGCGTKIDNQVQIGHNVQIGKDCMICGRVGIAGSAVLGDRVVIGGATGIADHVRIGDDAVLMAMSGVTGNIPARQIYGGIPAVPRQKALDNMVALNRLKALGQQVTSLAESVRTLEAGRQ